MKREKALKPNARNLVFKPIGSFHAKRPGPSSLNLFKFVQNMLYYSMAWLTSTLKILAQYLLYFEKYDDFKFATPLKWRGLSHIRPFSKAHFSKYKNNKKLIFDKLINFQLCFIQQGSKRHTVIA